MWGSFMLRTLLLALGCKLTPLFQRLGELTNLSRILFAILYWYLAFVALPRWYGYRVEEEVEVLSDGTSITKLVNLKNE